MRKALLIIRDIIVLALAGLVIFSTVKIIQSRENRYETLAVEDYLKTDNTVVVESGFQSILFDGPGTENVLVFYPANDVEAQAYAPLMHRLAEGGLDCIVLKMPVRNASLLKNAVDFVKYEYRYENWYVGGHGRGAEVAGEYALKHEEDIAGLVCLGGFAEKNLSMYSGTILMIHGTLDGVWDAQNYRSNAPYFAVEIAIDGGNFTQYAAINGLYENDNQASISMEKQQEETVKQILSGLKIQ